MFKKVFVFPASAMAASLLFSALSLVNAPALASATKQPIATESNVPAQVQLANDFDRRTAKSYAIMAEDKRNRYRMEAEGNTESFVTRAVKFDDYSNHSYACSIFANVLYKTAFGDKSIELKAKIFDTMEAKGQDSDCSKPNYGPVKYG